MIDRSLARKHDWLDRFETMKRHLSGANAGAEMLLFNLPAMSIGDFEIANAIVAVPGDGVSINTLLPKTTTGSRLLRRSKQQGFLGYDVLKHFVVTIDYRYGYVHLEPGQ